MGLAMLQGMRPVALVIGLLVLLAGSVFALQGANILPGSYMTGDRLWLVIGAVMVGVGLALAAWGWRRVPG
jgi:protein-S-isoprenylcysteine O-methyltransferase Ste14